MLGSAVQDERGDYIFGQASGKVIELKLPGGEVCAWQDERMGLAAFGLHRSEDVAPLVFGAARRKGTLIYRSPGPAVGRFETETRFVLKTEPHPLIRQFMA